MKVNSLKYYFYELKAVKIELLIKNVWTFILNYIQLIFKKLSLIENNGERVNINLNKKIDIEKLDMYQKSHYNRYLYAIKQIETQSIIGDFACGTGYGSVLLASKAKKVVSVDIDNYVIKKIRKRYAHINNIDFICKNIIDLDFASFFDVIVSFETIEHFYEHEILRLLKTFNQALKPHGKIIISTPYMQLETANAIKMGHHKTFLIEENKIYSWLNETDFTLLKLLYQNYDTHIIQENLEKRNFIIIIAIKNV